MFGINSSQLLQPVFSTHVGSSAASAGTPSLSQDHVFKHRPFVFLPFTSSVWLLFS